MHLGAFESIRFDLRKPREITPFYLRMNGERKRGSHHSIWQSGEIVSILV